jgi:hypothetical protein
VTVLFGVALMIGLALLIVWLVLAAVSSMVEGWNHVDPEIKWGTAGRSVVAAFVGFGMAGISVLYTTLPEYLSFVAALAGAAALAAVARWFVPPSAE